MAIIFVVLFVISLVFNIFAISTFLINMINFVFGGQLPSTYAFAHIALFVMFIFVAPYRLRSYEEAKKDHERQQQHLERVTLANVKRAEAEYGSDYVSERYASERMRLNDKLLAVARSITELDDNNDSVLEGDLRKRAQEVLDELDTLVYGTEYVKNRKEY